ncbi:MAG: sporulation protein [Candidatus Marinimicrobia bacterium]|nr:sporulation protein [Candidatus Neomarinimicrobiota bacterium]
MIESLVDTLLDKLKDIVASETVVGKPVETPEATIIPVSKISLGFGAGGGGSVETAKDKGKGSGTGGGAVIDPVAIISICKGEVKVHKLKEKGLDIGKIVELVPELISKFSKSKKAGKGRVKKE